MQKALREHCKGRTVLTIAHRLATIIDYDVVVVMGDGRVLEQGSPSELLSCEDSAFGRLVEATGAASSQYLRDAALRKPGSGRGRGTASSDGPSGIAPAES